MKSLAVALGLLLAVGAAAAKKAKKAKDGGLWLNSSDQRHSIEFPRGWPYPGRGRSISPPGLSHLFFLTTPDDAVAMDIAAGAKMTPEQYFEFIGGVRSPGEERASPVTTTLADRSTFKHFRSVERQGPVKQYFVQGVLAKKDGRYYVTITSPKRHPGKKEWADILGGLASLRSSPSAAGGGPVPPGGKNDGGSSVVTIGSDGSSLTLTPPWEPQAWGYTRRFAVPLHSFRRGPLRCELAGLGPAKTGPKALAEGLRAKYYESAGQRPAAGESEVSSRRLANGARIHFYRIALPGRDDDPRKQWLLEGFFALGGKTYYYLAAAAQDELSKEQFEKQSSESLGVIGKARFPK